MSGPNPSGLPQESGGSPSPGRFRKKPVVIDACPFDGNNHDAVYAWVNQWHQEDDGPGMWASEDTLTILTLEGEMEASPGDWIIRGVAGEFYPCKPDIFALTYEAAE